jgi:hypothetical protein
MDPAMLATRFFLLQRTFQPLVDGVFHNQGTFGANPKITESGGQRETTLPGCTVATGAIDLHKPAYHLDIFFLVLRYRLHSCNHALHKQKQT